MHNPHPHPHPHPLNDYAKVLLEYGGCFIGVSLRWSTDFLDGTRKKLHQISLVIVHLIYVAEIKLSYLYNKVFQTYFSLNE